MIPLCERLALDGYELRGLVWRGEADDPRGLSGYTSAYHPLSHPDVVATIFGAGSDWTPERRRAHARTTHQHYTGRERKPPADHDAMMAANRERMRQCRTAQRAELAESRRLRRVRFGIAAGGGTSAGSAA